MFGPGFRNNRVGSFRLVAMLGLLFVTLAFRGNSTGSSTTYIRIALFGAVAIGLAASRRRRGSRMGGAGYPNPLGRPNAGFGSPSSAVAPPPQPGWYPEPGSAAIQRYWDGSSWGQRRRWDGGNWVLE